MNVSKFEKKTGAVLARKYGRRGYSHGRRGYGKK